MNPVMNPVMNRVLQRVCRKFLWDLLNPGAGESESRSLLRDVFLRSGLLIVCAWIGLNVAGPWANRLLAQTAEIPQEVIDRDRSVRKQSEARSAAVASIREGLAAGNPQVVIPKLGDASGLVRDAAYSRLVKFSDEELDQVVEAWGSHPLRKASPATRGLIDSGLAEALFHRPRPDAEAWLLSVASSRKSDQTSRELSLAALSQLPSGSLKSKTLQSLSRLAEKEPLWWVRGEALLCLCVHDPVEARSAVEKAWSEKRSWPMRLISLQGQALLDAEIAIERSMTLLSDEIRDRKGIWGERLERTALTILAQEVPKLPRADRVAAIDLLISRALESANQTWHPEISVLRQLTGVDLSSGRASAWDSWWKSRRDPWLAGEDTGGTGAGSDDGEVKDDAGKTKVVEYHGVPIDSRKITFVSDVSGGMSRNLDGDFDGPGPRRLEVARKELLRVLSELPPESLVQVIYFASLRIPVLPAPQVLARCYRALKKRIDEQGVPQGRGESRGNLYAPLRAALFEPGIDTVMLLTEGAATEGRIHDGERLRWHVQRWNRWAQVRLHVLSVGRLSAGNRSFLEKLAQENAGGFHDIDDRFRKSVHRLR